MNSIYYTSLSGMMAATYSLQNTANNLANMQNPGFKRSDVFYATLGQGDGRHYQGSGVRVAGSQTNFSNGNHTATGNPSDLAIVGNGYFIIQLKSGGYGYTRDGEFGFNAEGLLIDKHSGGLVLGYDTQGNLAPIHQFGSKRNPGQATHSIDLSGEMIITPLEKNPNTPDVPDPFKSQYATITFSVGNVFDAKGKAHTLNLTLEAPSSPGTGSKDFDALNWTLINATCDDAALSFDPQSIGFERDADGSAKSGANTLTVMLNGQQRVTLNFGDFRSDTDASVRLFKKDAIHVNTSIDSKALDGFAEGKPIGFAFDTEGLITYDYDNGQSQQGIHVALARFNDQEQALVLGKDNLFHANPHQTPTLGHAGQLGFGSILPKQLESSNVDSTMEFSNIVILQRLFQACSQLIDIDKQLLEELFK